MDNEPKGEADYIATLEKHVAELREFNEGLSEENDRLRQENYRLRNALPNSTIGLVVDKLFDRGRDLFNRQ